MNASAKLSRVSIDSERRQKITDRLWDGEQGSKSEDEELSRHPAMTPMAAVALNQMSLDMPGSRAVDCIMAERKGTVLEAPYARTCIATLRPMDCE